MELLNNQFLEKALSEIESINAPIFKKIIQTLNVLNSFSDIDYSHCKILSQAEIIELSFYLAIQYLRTEEMRIITKQLTESIFKSIADKILSNSDEFKQEKLVKIYHLMSLIDTPEKIASILQHYKWVIAINNTNIPFYTSDAPVVLYPHIKHSFYGYGFATKGIEIFFPLSPKYAVIIYEPTYLMEKIPSLLKKTIIKLTEENALFYNDLMIHRAALQLFSNTNNFQLVEKRITTSPYVADKYRKRIEVK